MQTAVTRRCERCHKEFRIPASRAREGRGRFCSRACRTFAADLKCETCGETFRAKGNEVKNGRRYCSKRCHYSAHGRGVRRNNDGTATVELTRGLEAIIDIEDVPLVEGKSWQARPHRRTVYASTHIGTDTALLHQIIMKTPPGMVTDHIDGDGLNNRRSNLRVCTNSDNLLNTHRHRPQ